MAAQAREESPTTPADEAEEDRAELEKAFEEAAAEREGAPAKAADPDDDAPATPLTDEEGQPGGEVEAGKADETDEPGQDGAAADKAPDAGSEDDVWTGAPEELRKAREQELADLRKDFEHRFRSVTGRLSAADRELARLRAGRESEGGDQGKEERKALKDLLDTDEIKEVERDYPDLAPVLKSLRAVAERVDGVDQTVGEATRRQSQAALDAEEEALDGKVPNWRDLAKDERFEAWAAEQPRHIRDALARNWNAITDAAEAADVFERFAAAHPAEKKPEEDKGGDAPSRRERQAAGAKPVKATGPAAAQGEPEDLDGAFASAASKSDRQRGIK